MRTKSQHAIYSGMCSDMVIVFAQLYTKHVMRLLSRALYYHTNKVAVFTCCAV